MRLLFLGSSCIYLKLAEQSIREEALLTGPLKPINAWYSIAKIAGSTALMPPICMGPRRNSWMSAGWPP